MLSRIADSLFWLNRYIERSDILLRLLYVHHILTLDKSENGNSSWRTVLELSTSFSSDQISEIENDTSEVLKQILIDQSNNNSIKLLVTRARENARGAQDHITKEVWSAVNQMYHQVNHSSLPSRLRTDQAFKSVEGLATSTVLFTGITDNTMSRGLGWNFMQLGKYIERCLQTIAVCSKQFERNGFNESPNDILQWRNLLYSLSGYELHLKTYRSHDHINNVLHQVLINESFTRSVLYSLIRISNYLEKIMAIHEDQNKSLLRGFGRMFSKVRYLDVQSMDKTTVHNFLAEVQSDLLTFSNQLAQYYFSYS
ncbi:MAG TPA: alpha-E domain-containing protein [Candidatus Babeliaceae bacterium]|nr:alpha-E domain-containing protein [Candidatus Babeliaceae bacterium]